MPGFGWEWLMVWKRARIGAARALGALLMAAGLGLTAAPTRAADRLTIWDLKIGTPVAEMPPWIAFKGYACGSNGGPPLMPLKGWAGYAKCAAEANGLHEVYFEYDDEEEYIRRAHDDMRLARDIGTSDKSYPIIASALFDDQGVLKGLRMVTDPRQNAEPDNEAAELHTREEHYTYGKFLAGQWGIDVDTDCKSLPPSAGETPVGNAFVKLDCNKADKADGLRYLISIRYLRKPGQTFRDPHTGQLTEGEFESLTHAEMLALDVPVTKDDLLGAKD